MSQAQAAASKVILDAAKKSIVENLPLHEVADSIGVGRGILTSARILIEYATPEELKLVVDGKRGINPSVADIRKRFTPEQREQLRSRNGTWTAKRRDNIKTDAELWAIFKPTIVNLASLPDVIDMIRVVKGNTGRENYLKAQLEIASNWLKEFMDEWNKYQRGKSSEDTSDTGNGSPTVGS